MAAALSSAEASRWISLAGAAAALEPAASNGDVAKAAEHAATERAEVEIEQVKVDSTAAATLESYFNFGAYAIISSVIVSVGLVFSGMNEPERVRRMEAGPVSERQRSLAVFAAAAVLTVCIWFVSSMMGVVGFAGAVAEVGVGRVSWRWRRRLPWRARLWPLALRCRAWVRARSCLTVWATCSACS